MLNILLLILKIIGYILLTILGIVLLFILLILFTPLKYDIYGQVNNSIESLAGKVKFGYLFGILNGQFVFKDGRPRYYVAIFKKKIICSKKPKEANSDIDKENNLSDFKSYNNDVKEKDIKVPFEGEITEDDFKYIDNGSKDNKHDDNWDKLDADSLKIDSNINETEERKSKESYDCDKEKVNNAKTDKNRTDYKVKFYSIIDKIKNKYINICDKIKIIKEDKNLIEKFFNDKIHKKAFKKVFKEAKILLRKLKPYNLKGNVHYGFENPEITGKVLAGYSIASPYIGGELNIVPYFNNELLYRGNISFKGKIRLSYFITVIIKLAVCKCIWKTFKDGKSIIDNRNVGGK